MSYLPWKPETTPNFSLETDPNLACSHCGECRMTQEHMFRLQMFRRAYGPVHIISGYRCPQHPIEAAKSEPGSHAYGLATDIKVNGDLYKALQLAFRFGFVGIGIRQTSLHLDSGHPSSAVKRPAAWTYKD